MSNSRAYFVSDIHLENMQERNGQILLRFLHSLTEEEKAPDLYLLGDIFDLWLSGHGVFIKKFEPLFEPLRILKSKGSRLVYFEGNHDLHLHPFWEKELGFELYDSAQYHRIGNFDVRLEHGDQMNPDDLAYKRWRSFARNPVIEAFAHILPGKFWNQLGEKMSQKSRQRSRTYRKEYEDKIRDMIRSHAARAYQERPFDMIVSGHMHVKLDETISIEGRGYRNINLGSWIEGNPQALCVEGSSIKWVPLD
jgi:UDP-2,3-diacylglucosamine hydrolase